jgi:hypothetical protein
MSPRPALPRSNYRPFKSKRHVTRLPKGQPSNSRSGGGGFLKRALFWLVSLGVIAFLGITILGVIFAWFKPLEGDQIMLWTPGTKEQRSQKPVFLVLSPRDQSVTVINLPSDLTLDLGGEYGTYALSAAWPLMKIDDRDQFFIRSAVGKGLDRLVTLVVPMAPVAPINSDKELNTFLWQHLKSVRWQPQHWVVAWQWYWFARRIPRADIKITTITSQEEWQTQVEKLAQAHSYADCSVSVVNTTNTPGLAGTLSHIFENSGLTVLKQTDSAAASEKSFLAISDRETDSSCVTVSELLQAAMPQPLKIETRSDLTSQYRSDIVFVAGQDAAAFYGPR